jgi:hypothetical protein
MMHRAMGNVQPATAACMNRGCDKTEFITGCEVGGAKFEQGAAAGEVEVGLVAI